MPLAGQQRGMPGENKSQHNNGCFQYQIHRPENFIQAGGMAHAADVDKHQGED